MRKVTEGERQPDCLKLTALPLGRVRLPVQFWGEGGHCSSLQSYSLSVAVPGWESRKGEALWAREAALCGPLADEGFCGIPQAASPPPPVRSVLIPTVPVAPLGRHSDSPG